MCSKPNGINCAENFKFDDCEQLENTKFKNYGCKHIVAYESDTFECINRSDKRDVLFESPPISIKKTRKTRNYNTELLHDDFYIYCGEFNFTYEDFYQVSQLHGQEECEIADGTRYDIVELWQDLLTNFSFNMTKKINEL